MRLRAIRMLPFLSEWSTPSRRARCSALRNQHMDNSAHQHFCFSRMTAEYLNLLNKRHSVTKKAMQDAAHAVICFFDSFFLDRHFRPFLFSFR
jgi:hypothetical protein